MSDFVKLTKQLGLNKITTESQLIKYKGVIVLAIHSGGIHTNKNMLTAGIPYINHPDYDYILRKINNNKNYQKWPSYTNTFIFIPKKDDDSLIINSWRVLLLSGATNNWGNISKIRKML